MLKGIRAEEINYYAMICFWVFI